MFTANQGKSPLHVRDDSTIPTSVSELRLRDFVAMGIGAFIGYLILTSPFKLLARCWRAIRPAGGLVGFVFVRFADDLVKRPRTLPVASHLTRSCLSLGTHRHRLW